MVECKKNFSIVLSQKLENENNLQYLTHKHMSYDLRSIFSYKNISHLKVRLFAKYEKK